MGERIILNSNDISTNDVTARIHALEDARKLKTLIQAFSDTMYSRSGLIGRLGKSYWDPNTGVPKRDVYDALGYSKDPLFQDYYNLYKRQDIANRIINAPCNAVWNKVPLITENIGKETKFENDWKNLVKRNKIYHYLNRADKLSGIGEYGILLMGFNDDELDKPLTRSGPNKNRKLLYLMPYSQLNCSIHSWNNDSKNERYGKPEIYRVIMRSLDRTGVSSRLVHHSRVLHLSETLLEDDVYGEPKLKKIFNRLKNLELILGGSAEMFWQGAFPGMSFEIDADASTEDQDLDDLRDQIETYVHGLKRYLRLKGVKANQLSPNIADPTNHFMIQLRIIAGTEGFPLRILIGSEAAQLASSQDEKNWEKRTYEKMTTYAEPWVLRPFIDTMVFAGVISSPESGNYDIIWPPLSAPSEKEKAETSKIKAETLSIYSNSLGSEDVIPVTIFLEKIMGFSEEEVQEIISLLNEIDDEDFLEESSINEEGLLYEGAQDDENDE